MNIKAVSGTLVHKAVQVKRWGNTVPAPACRSFRQLERQVLTGVDTDEPINCPRCLKEIAEGEASE